MPQMSKTAEESNEGSSEAKLVEANLSVGELERQILDFEQRILEMRAQAGDSSSNTKSSLVDDSHAHKSMNTSKSSSVAG